MWSKGGSELTVCWRQRFDQDSFAFSFENSLQEEAVLEFQVSLQKLENSVVVVVPLAPEEAASCLLLRRSLVLDSPGPVSGQDERRRIRSQPKIFWSCSPVQTTSYPHVTTAAAATMRSFALNVAVFLFGFSLFADAWTTPCQQPMTRTRQRRTGAKRSSFVSGLSTNYLAFRQNPRCLLKLPDEDDVDTFLDTPFYDPDKVLEDKESSEPSKRFAMFVKNDYETAEALLAGAFFVVLVVVAQELLRLHIQGGNYVPFTSGGSVGGRLF
jgi:hypothetical protein